jgi:hypothetical protein
MRGCLVAVTLCTSVAAASAQDDWNAWYYKARQTLRVIENQVKETTDYRDQACPGLEPTPQSICLGFFETIRYRRNAQWQELSLLLDIAHTMSDAERDKLLKERIPVYNRTEADTMQMFQEAQKMFPPKKK